MLKKESLSIIVIQSILVYISFYKFFESPNLYLFDNWYDGLKNYFTWYGYISYNFSDSFFNYNLMNYPYGEFVFFTDNSPLFAISLKLLKSNFVIDNATAIHNLFFILAIIPASLLLYKILQVIIKNSLLRIVTSICLPWILPQFFRIDNHFNLSMSVFFFWNLLSLIKIYSYKFNKNKYLWFVSLFLSIFISSFFHLYYTLIFGIFSISFNFFVFLIERNKQSFKIVSISMFVTISSIIAVYIILYLIDDYSSLRLEKANGYDWLSWKLRIENLFMRNEWFAVPFLFNYEKNLGIETYAYLGSFALYGSLYIIAYIIFKKEQPKTNIIIIVLFLSGFVLFAVSLGENIVFSPKDITIKNIFNPLLYLHFISEKVTQFRCLGRFNWYFVIVFNIVIIYYVDKIIYLNKKNIIAYSLLLFLMIDALSVVKYRFNIKPAISAFHSSSLTKYNKLQKTVDADNYQAILYFPYFNVGSENYDYTIDPDYRACVEAFQLSYIFKLPLMNSKLSRTPLQYVKNLFEFSIGIKNNDISAKLNKKDVLVIINKELYINGYKPTNSNALELYNKQASFIESLNKHKPLFDDVNYKIVAFKFN